MRRTRVAVVGLHWWGPGPNDFAREADRFEVVPVAVANLLSPVESRMLRLPVVREAATGWRTLRRARDVELIVVLTPHRVPRRVLERIGRHARLVAWLGDDPVGPRAFNHGWTMFDRVFAADGRWVPGAITMPWPHLVPRPQPTPFLEDSERRAVVVGTPYPERVTAARRLRSAGWDVLGVGAGWPADLPSSKPLGRLETLRFIRGQRRLVMNIPHPQMRNTLNPFFLDVAASGLPQVYLAHPTPEALRGVPEPITSISELLATSPLELLERTTRLQAHVIDTCSVDARLTHILESSVR